MQREQYMSHALTLAQEALADGEVPVGAVIVQSGRIIGRGRNRREKEGSALAHAEIEAIAGACASLGDWRLLDCELYVTLEPCPMCAGAIINARIPCVYFGARDERAGACGSVLNLFEEGFGHRPKVYPGLLADESAQLLCRFFQSLRRRGKS